MGTNKILKIASAVLIIINTCSCTNNKTVHPQKKDIIETVYASGKIMADSEYTVYALNPGTVIQKLKKEGDHVKKGQILYVINNTAQTAKLEAADMSYHTALENLSPRSRILSDLKLSMQNADIKFGNDSLQYVRLKNLWSQNIGTKSALDNAEVQYRTSLNEKHSAKEKYFSTINDLNISLKNAKSQVASARTELSNYIIRAENDGTVYQMTKEKGEAVKANEAIVMLGKSSARLIRLAVDQQDIDRIKVGQQVLLKTDATGENIFKASVVRIYPTMNDADQTFRVDAVFNDNGPQSYIHTSVEANIIIQQKHQVLVVPSRVLLNGDSVKVKKDGRTRTIAIKTGIHTMDEVEVADGLDEQSELIIPAEK
jgi:HlyD family secretion protein